MPCIVGYWGWPSALHKLALVRDLLAAGFGEKLTPLSLYVTRITNLTVCLEGSQDNTTFYVETLCCGSVFYIGPRLWNS